MNFLGASAPRQNGWRTNLEACWPLASLLQLWNTLAAYLFPIPRGPLRHIHCKLLLAFATFLFTLLACTSERGIAELQLDGMPSMNLTTAIKDEINVKNE